MNTFRNISGELKSFFSTNPIFKILLPIDSVFVFGGLGILLLNYLNFILAGNFFYTLGYYALALGIVLAFANYRLMFIYIGFFAYGLLQLVDFFWSGLRTYGYWSFFTIVTCAISLALGYFVFRKSTIQTE